MPVLGAEFDDGLRSQHEVTRPVESNPFAQGPTCCHLLVGPETHGIREQTGGESEAERACGWGRGHQGLP